MHRPKNANKGPKHEGSLEKLKNIEATNFGHPEVMQGNK